MNTVRTPQALHAPHPDLASTLVEHEQFEQAASRFRPVWAAAAPQLATPRVTAAALRASREAERYHLSLTRGLRRTHKLLRGAFVLVVVGLFAALALSDGVEGGAAQTDAGEASAAAR